MNKITPRNDVLEIRERYETMPHIWSIGGLADYYGRDWSTIKKIVTYQTHRHVKPAARRDLEAAIVCFASLSGETA